MAEGDGFDRGKPGVAGLTERFASHARGVRCNGSVGATASVYFVDLIDRSRAVRTPSNITT
jgi:hypothetical protein